MDGQDTIFLSYKIAQFIGNAVGFCVTSHFCDVTSTAAAAAAAAWQKLHTAAEYLTAAAAAVTSQTSRHCLSKIPVFW